MPTKVRIKKFKRAASWISIIIPGMLVAATGVGAGDLITASLAGSEVGLVLLWTAVAGGAMKWTLNEGLTRWQMAIGTSLLEGWVKHLGWSIYLIFILYFLIWSYSVGGALINACERVGPNRGGNKNDRSKRTRY